MGERFLRRPEVISVTGFSASKIETMYRCGEFPEPRQIGARAIAWLGSEVDEWIRSRPKVSDVERVRPGEKTKP